MRTLTMIRVSQSNKIISVDKNMRTMFDRGLQS